MRLRVGLLRDIEDAQGSGVATEPHCCGAWALVELGEQGGLGALDARHHLFDAGINTPLQAFDAGSNTTLHVFDTGADARFQMFDGGIDGRAKIRFCVGAGLAYPAGAFL